MSLQQLSQVLECKRLFQGLFGGVRLVYNEMTYGRCIYIRELIEEGCHEFESSEIPASERLQIIEAVGQDRVIALLRENFEYKKRPFSEKRNALEGIKALKEMAASERIQ